MYTKSNLCNEKLIKQKQYLEKDVYKKKYIQGRIYTEEGHI